MEVREPLRKADPSAPSITRRDMLNCQIAEWYPHFSKHTLKTKFLELSPEFVDYMLADGLMLPVGCEAPSAHSAKDSDDENWSDFSGSSSESVGEQDPLLEGSEHLSEQPTQPRFDDLIRDMNKAIDELGGEAFPKLMWSCPRDATWINAGENCRCVSAADVVMLLKSSDFITHDLCHAFDCCVDGPAPEAEADVPELRDAGGAQSWRRPKRVVLALRKWFDGLRNSMEFRCYVHEDKLVGISQRHCSQAFDFLMDSKRQIIDTLSDFHKTIVKGRFTSDSYVMDCYIRQRDWRVFIIDFNVFGGLTQPLLFSWHDLLSPEAPPLRLQASSPSLRQDAEASFAGEGVELRNCGIEAKFAGEGVELRLVTQGNMLPSESMYSRLPADLLDVGSGSAIDEFVRNERNSRQNQSSSSPSVSTGATFH